MSPGGIGGGPEPTGKPGGPGLWGVRGMQLPHGVQHIALALMARGHSRGEAIAIAVGSLKRWSRGGGHVSAKTRVLAARNIVQWEAKRARAHRR